MKKRILVAGAAGMAGHVIYRYLKSLDKYHMRATTRGEIDEVDSYIVDVVQNLNEFIRIVQASEIDVIINCIGMLVKPSQENPTQAIFINSFFPHVLEDITRGTKTKVIHLSTDCIFSGKDGPYNELDLPTETNWYGRTKALGEIDNDKDLTMRTSIIGPELKDGTGLFHWFSKQTGKIQGYQNHYWNGITTLEMAKQIDKVLDLKENLTGIYHFAPRKPITKGDLLEAIRCVWDREDVEVELVETEVGQNKTLVNNRKKEYNPHFPSYPDQLKELKKFLVTVQ